MVKSVKGVKGVKGDYVDVRVLVPKDIHKALKVKCALSDISVNRYIIHLITKNVKGVKDNIDAISAKM